MGLVSWSWLDVASSVNGDGVGYSVSVAHSKTTHEFLNRFGVSMLVKIATE
jgi:hypothetical protein